LLSSDRWLLPQPAPVFDVIGTLHTISDASVRLPDSAKQLLTAWYEMNVRHPYPQPEELAQLVSMTGQSRRKILKWLANRRARTGNTLTHNGSVHPRKIIKIRQLRQQAAESEPSRHEQPRTPATNRHRHGYFSNSYG